MDRTTNASRLRELRARTDRQLVAFLGRRLDAGIAYAGAVPAKAEQVYEEVRALLPWVRGVGNAERRRLETKLEKLRELLADFSAEPIRVQTACS